MVIQKYHTRILVTLFSSALVSSCSDTAQPTNTGTKSTVEQIHAIPQINTPSQRPDQITIQRNTAVTPKPALNLSIKNIADAQDIRESDAGINQQFTNGPDSQTQRLTSKQKNDGIKLSGKLFTDQEMIDTGEYLHSIDGLQLNIEGNFR